jgi:hypothetical protein
MLLVVAKCLKVKVLYEYFSDEKLTEKPKGEVKRGSESLRQFIITLGLCPLSLSTVLLDNKANVDSSTSPKMSYNF